MVIDMVYNNDINIDEWKMSTPITPSTDIAKTHKSPPQSDHRFIRAPLPYDWTTTAAKLPGKTLHVAMAIRYLKGFADSNTIKLSHKPANQFGVGVKALYSALKHMEQAGLISVERAKGKSPRITILNV